MPSIQTFTLKFPFTSIDVAYVEPIKLVMENMLGSIQGYLATPLLATVTLWIAIQGILVMRGDIDTRQGFGKMLMVAIVVALISSATLYHDYVYDFFQNAVPHFVQQVGNDGGLPAGSIPTQIDLVFDAGERIFLDVSEHIDMNDQQNILAFEGAQFMFYMLLWGIFGVYDLNEVLMYAMVAIGPLMLFGFLFQATRDVTVRWIGQLISYGLLLLLISVLATVVVAIELGALAVIATMVELKPTHAEIIGLYEMDMFFMTGNAIVVALPGLAATMGGGVAVALPRFANSLYRRFSPDLDRIAMASQNDPLYQAKAGAIMNRYFTSGGMQP